MHPGSLGIESEPSELPVAISGISLLVHLPNVRAHLYASARVESIDDLVKETSMSALLKYSVGYKLTQCPSLARSRGYPKRTLAHYSAARAQ